MRRIFLVFAILIFIRLYRLYWTKWGKLEMHMTDGYHVMIDGQCYTL